MDSTMAIILAPIGFIAFFVAMWLTVCAVLSVIGGWRGLSEIFPDTSPAQTTQFAWQSMNIEWVNYRNCVNVSLADDGLHLSLMVLLRFMHRPLCLPWPEIASVEADKFLFVTRSILKVRRTGTRLYFYGKLGEAVLKEWQKRFPAPPRTN